MRVENQPDMSVLVSSIQGYKKGKMTRKVSVFLDKGIDISTEAFEEVTTLPPVAEAKTGEFYILPDGSVNYISGGTWKTIALTLYSEPGSNTDGAMTQKAVSETLFTDPDGQTQVRIGKSAFNQCYSLENINLPDSLAEIDGNAFGKCASLKTITLPKGLKAVGLNAFVPRKDDVTNFIVPEEMELEDWSSYSFDQVNEYKVKVVKGSWADIHFDEVFKGEAVKEY